MPTRHPIIFSGHNDRAVVALCRYFDAAGLPFSIVASFHADAIYRTYWHKRVLLQREDRTLTLGLMERISRELEAREVVPTLCPTSEFLNRFVLDNREALEEMGWVCFFPEKDLYLRLSDKQTSPPLIKSLVGIATPPRQNDGHWTAPCVLKPRSNVVDGKVLYPLLCRQPEQLEAALQQIDREHWFHETWIDGQSIYLCAYLDKKGNYDSFWQENLMQQEGGKSIVLARTTKNPGLDEDRLMAGLHAEGYFGPIMMELMRDESGKLYYIEVNPRFWGPLNLAVAACPGLLHRFATDLGLVPERILRSPENTAHWYAWAFGAHAGSCRRYPASLHFSNKELEKLLMKHDVYAAADTSSLSNQH